MLKPIFLTFLLVSLVVPVEFCWGDDAARVMECTGFYYKAKTEAVPVYEEADSSSKVIARLNRGEQVCYVGEEKGFAILDWKEREPAEKKLAFVQLSSLWEVARAKSGKGGIEGVLEKAKSYFYYMRSGGVPEDALGPYRPLMDIVPDTSCPASGSESCEEE